VGAEPDRPARRDRRRHRRLGVPADPRRPCRRGHHRRDRRDREIDGASKILEFLASKQRKAAVCLILAGQRATATWTGGAGVRINLSTVVTGMLARDSESRHAVGAENEIPDIAEYSGGEAGFF
jgi:hypothetical protein